jgi:phenylacetaldehyde dehydrogenase
MADAATLAKVGKLKAGKYKGWTGKLLINGEWLPAVSGQTFDVIDPATEEVVCKVASADKEDVDRAVKAARAAFESPAWRDMKPAVRERLMHRLADLIEANIDELSEVESIDNGKLFMHAHHVDLPAALGLLRYYAGWPTKIEGRTIQPSVYIPGPDGKPMDFFTYTLREPVGVCGGIIPWNFPLIMAMLKVAPALAAGCTMILKPAEQTPLSALRLGELIGEAGFPPGVINILTGFGETAGAALVDHPGVDKIAFTGSTDVGKLIARNAAASVKRVSLELGGKSPMIVGPDADLDAAIPGLAQGIFFNQGQVCLAGSRLYVEKKSFDKVVGGIADIANAMKIGPGLDFSSQLGPVVSEEQLQRVLGYIEKGRAEGGHVAAGGERHGNQGYFVKPTVITGLGPNASPVQEEIFGPVLVATPYSDIDEVAKLANSTAFGLGASIWSRDNSFITKMARRVRSGMIWVNCHLAIDAQVAMGGFKQSGYGREQGAEGLDLYLESKSVTMRV